MDKWARKLGRLINCHVIFAACLGSDAQNKLSQKWWRACVPLDGMIPVKKAALAAWVLFLAAIANAGSPCKLH